MLLESPHLELCSSSYSCWKYTPCMPCGANVCQKVWGKRWLKLFSQKFELKFEANFCSNFLFSLAPSHSFLLQPFSKLSSPIINQPNTSKLCSKSWDIHSSCHMSNYGTKTHENASIYPWLIESKETWNSTQLAYLWLKKVHKINWKQKKKTSETRLRWLVITTPNLKLACPQARKESCNKDWQSKVRRIATQCSW